MPSNSQLPRVCIIGAGSSGIATAKVLHERGFAFDCFEASDRVGGNWVFENVNGMSACYRHLHINVSRERMAYSDFPMPSHYPDFPHHADIAAYFESYVDHFGFRDRITFNTWVDRCQRRPDGLWEVTLRGGEVRLYDALAVANGHHWDPRWPDPPFAGRFDGEELHAHAYIDNAPFRGKRVVIVGMGNSAMDIAAESCQVAERTILSARRGAHVLPKYAFGRPLDSYPLPPWLPFAVRKRILAAVYRLVVGRVERYGLPRPQHAIWQAHPTVSSFILPLAAHGELEVKPNIAELRGDAVRFEDGTEAPADIIVYCTGYRVSFPFFDPDFISAPQNDLPLFRRVFKPGLDNLFFIGLLQPLGAIMPLAEAQSEWMADYLAGRYALPDERAMRADMARERRALARRYVRSERHTMQVDYDDYLYHLKRERRRGKLRAVLRAFARPVPARAQGATPDEGREEQQDDARRDEVLAELTRQAEDLDLGY